MTETLILGILVIFVPVFMAYVNARQVRVAKAQEWEREDVVAEKAAKVAEEAAKAAEEAANKAAEAALLLLAAQEETKTRTDEVAVLAAENAAATATQLKQIHTLVNSDMTAARKDQLHKTEALLRTQKSYAELLTDKGMAVPQELLDDIAANEAQIEELRAILADRLHQQRAVEAEQRADPDAQPKGGNTDKG